MATPLASFECPFFLELVLDTQDLCVQDPACPFYFTSQSYPPEVPKEVVRDLDSGSPSAQAKGIFMVHKESYDFICQVVHEINMAK